jgi:hypothetical protein
MIRFNLTYLKGLEMKMYKWTVEVSVSENWIDDGFTLKEEKLQQAILENLLGYAYPHEVDVKIKKSPAIK